DPHRSIDRRIVILVPREDVHRDRKLLQRARRIRQRPLHHISQKGLAPLRRGKHFRAQDAVELFFYLRRRRFAPVVHHETAPTHLVEPIGVTHVTYDKILPQSHLWGDLGRGWPEAFPRKEVRIVNIRLAASLCLAAFAASIASAQTPAQPPQLSSNTTVYATGLEAPRGLKFGPDGNLYVAEAGTGGSVSTVGSCAQVLPPIGAYLGGKAGRISKLDKSGKRTTVASGFPSTLAAEGDLQGVADSAFLDGTLYAVTAGGGCSHGNPSSPNIIASVDIKSGSWK